MFKARIARPFDECWLKDPATECHNWQRSLDRYGYGERIWINGRRIAPHCAAYEKAKGPVPAGKIVRHRCDNRACVNPDHLLIGTEADNSRDMTDRQRQARGERQGLSKLNATDIERIRDIHRAGESQTAIARYFGVSQPVISQIVLRKTWRHV